VTTRIGEETDPPNCAFAVCVALMPAVLPRLTFAEDPGPTLSPNDSAKLLAPPNVTRVFWFNAPPN